MSTSTFFKGNFKWQNAAAYMTTSTHPPFLHQKSQTSSYAKILLPPNIRIALPQISAHLQILGLHTIRPTPMCLSTLLEQYTDAPSQTPLGFAHHAIWNTKGRHCLNACNKNCLKKLDKEIPEAEWKINCMHNVNPCCYQFYKQWQWQT